MIRRLSVLLALGLALVSCFSAGAEEGTGTLRVALYPYVPDPARCEAEAERLWQRIHPETELEFVYWDSYREEIPEDLDVFVFDAIFLTGYGERGQLLEIPEEYAQGAEDFLPFALEGCRVNGALLALPQLVCTNLLYTRPGDEALADAADIPSLYAVLGERKAQEEIPGEGEGLLIDMSGGTTKVTMYLDARCDVNGAYSDYTPLPDAASFSPEALQSLRLLRDMGGSAQVQYEPEDYDAYLRGRWFAEGLGRALIGYSEIMSAMGDYASGVNIRPFSYSDAGDVPIFFGDLVGVRADIGEEKKALALDMVRLLTGTEYLTAVCAADEAHPVPSYLMPSRLSAYDALSAASPVYGKLREAALAPSARLLRMGSGAMDYIARAKKLLPELVFGE